MNVIEIKGGLGNQLFQYAFGKAQEKYNEIILYNNEFYKRPQKYNREYLLNKFGVNLTFSSFKKQYTLIENGKYDINFLKLKNTNFKGYWQYLPYINELIPILQKEIKLIHTYYNFEFEFLLHKIINTKSLAIHVRRGDYLKQTWGVLPMSYYLNSINQLKMLYDTIFIFSDDIVWCEKNFKQKNFSEELHFINIEDYYTFELMRNCHHIIMANSTFSWWAAMLNTNKKKTVICPKTWLGGELNNELIYLPEWIKL